MPHLPKLPDLDSFFSVIDKASGAIDNGLGLIDKVSDKLDQLGISDTPSAPPTRTTESQKTKLLPTTVTETSAAEKPTEDIATACVPCALGHFSTSAGLLNEAVRFKGEGISSNEILDRISKCLQEQNALERVDLAPEMIQNTPPWEKGLAEEALSQSRALRHRLESINSIEELEKAATDATSYYRKLNRQWYKGRFSSLGGEKAEAISQRIGGGRKL